MKNLLSTCLPYYPLPSANLPARFADQHRSEKSDPDPQHSKRPDPDIPIRNIATEAHPKAQCGVVEAHNGAMEAHSRAVEVYRPVLQISFIKIQKPYPKATEWNVRIRIKIKSRNRIEVKSRIPMYTNRTRIRNTGVMLPGRSVDFNFYQWSLTICSREEEGELVKINLT
jgi:hypothetical protein